MASPYDEIIDELGKDEEFLSLDEESQNQIIEELAQERFSKVPSSESFLERVIKQSRSAGQAFGQFTPANTEEMRDLGKVGIRQAVPESPGLVGIGAQIADNRPGGIKLPEPQTEYGRNLETAANVGQLVHPVVGGAKLAGKGISQLIKSIRTTPAKNQIEELIYTGGKAVRRGVDDMFKDYNTKFGDRIGKLESSMSSEDYTDILRKTMDELGQGHPMTNNLQEEINNMEKISGKVFTPQEVQNNTARISKRMGGDTRSKSIFHKYFLDRIDEKVPGLRELKAEHAPVYSKSKAAKSLNQANMRRVARGNIGPTQKAELLDAEKGINVDILSRIEGAGKNLKTATRNKEIAKIIGGGAGVTGATALLFKLFGGQNQ